MKKWVCQDREIAPQTRRGNIENEEETKGENIQFKRQIYQDDNNKIEGNQD